MTTFVLVNFAHGAKLVHIFGTIQAETPEEAAQKIGSEIIESSRSGALSVRHLLRESVSGSCYWFLEAITPLSAPRPAAMDMKYPGR